MKYNTMDVMFLSFFIFLLNDNKEFNRNNNWWLVLTTLYSLDKYHRNIRKIKVGSVETQPILINSGLRQGDSISPILFNLILERVVRETDIQSQEGLNLSVRIGYAVYIGYSSFDICGWCGTDVQIIQ